MQRKFGAPETDEIEITPTMIEAGEQAIFAFGVRPNLSTADWASALAGQVYQAMEAARCPMRINSDYVIPQDSNTLPCISLFDEQVRSLVVYTYSAGILARGVWRDPKAGTIDVGNG